ncbi:MAG: cyclic nucleotide-binding domain-containing protein [Deltaproteobacteria bacterium]|nr:cyclic nucleotide-binding domain-containing protein [Deltaproteobacteria bacterium]
MKESQREEQGVSPLDRAHGYRLEGDVDNALRLAVSILVASENDLGAAALVTRILADSGRNEVAGASAKFLVKSYISRGDLASACVAARIGADAGLDEGGLLRAIAEAFGKGSSAVKDGSLSPPPLPLEVEIAPFFEKLSGEQLFGSAEKALQRFMQKPGSSPDIVRLPRLPLFGAIEPPVLEKLLRLQRILEVKPGQYVVKQGEEGKEAYVVVRGVLNVVRENGSNVKLLAALGPGAIFGEMALVSQAPRAASVVAVEPVQLLVISREHLEQLAGREPVVARELSSFCHGRMVSNLMRHSAIFAAIHPKKRQEMITRFEARAFDKGGLLVREGQEAEGLFLIASGGVQVTTFDKEGDLVVLAELGPGDVVGEISLLLRRPATADVVAIHPTVALQLTRGKFQETIRENPTLLAELYELATKREEETRSVVAQQALDVRDVVLL